MISIFHTFKKYKLKYLPKDILTGIIIAAVSIPISMGYAQIAGLPAVYGLYGSVFPIIIFAIFSTSRQFIFGVDAAPAALVGSSLITLGIEAASDDAINFVPLITFFTAIWLMLFFFFGAGKLVNYISSPVMGGFISGICCTIILMQIPKLFGGTSGTGEFFELSMHLIQSLDNFNLPSLLLGLLTLSILLISKKLIKKFPMAVVVMIAGGIISYNVDLNKYKIATLSAVEPGLPSFKLPAFGSFPLESILGVSLTIAIVIMAETLLAENNFALKNDYKINDNQELLAFSFGNFAAAFTGCCPINGSVSRSSMGEQYGGRTQVMSIVAGLSMIFVLLFGTPFIKYLPVPVLTAIVISALMGALEFNLAKKLWYTSRSEFYIFCCAFVGVLILGTIFGVVIGVILSFTAVVIKEADPPRCFLGLMPGHETFFNISQFKHVYPVEHVVIYRFTSNLFFANINIFQNDIEQSIKDDTIAIIVDASGISSIDATAAERLEIIHKNLAKKNIKFYMTEHVSSLNDKMRALGIGHLVREGVARKTIDDALNDIGFTKPYKIEGTHLNFHSVARKRAENAIQEFVWAFGSSAEEEIEKQIHSQIERMAESKDIDKLIHGSWNQLDSMDEDEWLEHLEAHIAEIANISGEDEKTIAHKFEARRHTLYKKIQSEHPELADKFKERRHALDQHLKDHHPDVYEKIIKLREDLK